MAFSEDEIDRYARQLVLSELGGPGQQRLRAARVAMVGVGGVGSPAALYLAAAGVGALRLIDPDTVSVSNLHRQILFDTPAVRRSKVEAARDRLVSLNPHVSVEVVDERLDQASVERLIAACDLVLDGCDDFQTRLTVNAACVAGQIPLVSGALGRWSGQVGIFTGRPCYRCLVSEPPPDAETCVRAGVVGPVAGVIGSLAAVETIKYLTGAGASLAGRLLLYDGLTAAARTVVIQPDPACPVCG